jgi:hypothetical protein
MLETDLPEGVCYVFFIRGARKVRLGQSNIRLYCSDLSFRSFPKLCTATGHGISRFIDTYSR